ncbi:MAG: cysteine synthase family protein [Balneolaceae bacterium]|nr:cysteine synthase family protein [Balneolaceae bacterium]
MNIRNPLSTNFSRRSFLKIAGAGSLAMIAPNHDLTAAINLIDPQMRSEQKNTFAIGNTPLIKLQHLPDEDIAEIWIKWEGANPTGSMKDRMALGMIEEAEKSGELKSGMRIVEVTGGSTGSSLAMVCGPKGYKAHFVATDAISIEKRQTMAALGATLEIIPSHGEGITPELIELSMARIHELEREPDTFWTNQFGNPTNATGYRVLGHELLEAGQWNAFVMGVGTGGCLSGVASALNQDQTSKPIVVAVEPAASRNLSGGPTGGHRIEGIGLGFVPETARLDLIDEIEAVTDEQAFETTRALARQEGLFAGPSSGANVAAAIRIAKRLGKGKKVVTLLCDSGLRYLSDDVFEMSDV